MSRKIDEYMSNPDEFSVDEDNVQELIDPIGQSAPEKPEEDLTDKGEAEEGSGAGDGKKDEAEEVTPEDDGGAKETKSVVKTRDGKHEIPYSVLEQERREKIAAQQRADEVQQQLLDLQKQLSGASTHENTQDQASGESADKDDFDLEAFREEFGDELAETERKRREKYAAMEARQLALEKEIEESRKWRESQEEKGRQSVESEINEAVDSLPELREWRDTKDPMWDAAVALDNRLKDDPAYADYSYRDRFAAVVERLAGRNKAQTKPTKQDAQKALDKALSESEASTGIPSSLSDLPGGHTVDQSEQESLERMSVTQLEEKFASMTPDQQREYLARL